MEAKLVVARPDENKTEVASDFKKFDLGARKKFVPLGKLFYSLK